MGFFDKKSKEPAEPKKTIPALWEYAKEITIKEVEQGDLPPGWYFWQDGYVWYAKRVNLETGEMEKSSYKHDPRQLEEWLGIPIKRAESLFDNKTKLEKKIDTSSLSNLAPVKGLSDKHEKEPELPPDDIENEWAVKKMLGELEEKAAAQEPPKRKAGRKSLGRTNQIMMRLTDSELVKFQRRVNKSGLAQGEFLRNAALNAKIVIKETDPTSISLLDELALLRAEMGRQGGMLKMIIKPNEGQRELTPNEWEELIAAIREMEKTKERLAKLEVKLNGNYNS